jgi:prepilin-type N-terminal cleavage/methylation domain-containing protein
VGDDPTPESGFTLIELMMALLVMTIVVTSLAYVLTNALIDTAYARQRATAVTLANQTVEELRALPWATLENGLVTVQNSSESPDSTYTTDTNISNGCFDNEPLDVNGSGSGSCSGTVPPWSNPGCLSSATSAPPVASALTSPEPLDPHQACYKVSGTGYGVDVYITWVAGTALPPVSATVVVSWDNALRPGVDERIVTTTQISNCEVGVSCDAAN